MSNLHLWPLSPVIDGCTTAVSPLILRGEATQVQRSYVACPMSHSKRMTEPVFEIRPIWPQGPLAILSPMNRFQTLKTRPSPCQWAFLTLFHVDSLSSHTPFSPFEIGQSTQSFSASDVCWGPGTTSGLLFGSLVCSHPRTSTGKVAVEIDHWFLNLAACRGGR